eukprot:GHVP01054883.1.p1 GENE.GHVP01054883.1~~GHVP01054883.1.p1  ORF type:complete len:213 (+),score=35.27 GHVP01054883.1:158-796(+)
MKPSAKDDYFCKKSILKNYDKENKTQDFFGDYHYDQNGRDWNVTCIIGSQQSPVLIRQNPVSWHLSRLSVSDFSPMWRTGDNLITQCEYEMCHQGFRITTKELGALGWSSFNNRRYLVEQFHFHSGAEHLFESDKEDILRRDVEAHIVHALVGEAEDIFTPQFLVIGVTFNATKELQSEFWNEISSIIKKGPKINQNIRSNILQKMILVRYP